MKKTPRKFSEGGKAAPASTPQPKPQEKKDPMPDWAKKDLEQKNQDAKTRIGYEAATAADRLKKHKAGGKVKKFAGGGSFSSDVYERARKQIQDKYSNDSGESSTPALDEMVSKAKEKEAPAKKPTTGKTTSPEARSSTPSPKAAPKAAPKKDEPSPSRSRSDFAGEMDSPPVRRGGIYARGAGPVLPPPIASETGALPSERKRNEALQRMAEERARPLAEARSQMGKAKGLEENFPDLRSPSEKSMDRGERLKRTIRSMLGLKDEYKKGGKVAKYAKGGGIEAKGKTKGTVVKMAAGGSVKGWGIARGSKACKMK